jgi:hypothetical protein
MTVARRTSTTGFHGTPTVAKTVIRLEIKTAPAVKAKPMRAGNEKSR